MGTDTQRVMDGIILGLDRPVFSHSREYLYHFLCKALMYLWPKPSLALTVVALITSGAVLLRLWDFAGRISMAMAVGLYGFFYFGASMNITRQLMAVALIFYFSRYLFAQKYGRFCLGVVAATFIHSSGCVAVLLLAAFLLYYDFPGIKRNWLRRSWMIPAAGAVLIILGIFLYQKYAVYLEFSGIRIGIMQPVVFCILIAAYVLLCLGRRKEAAAGGESAERKNIRFLFLICVIGYCLSLMGYIVPDLGRLNYYFKIFELVFYGTFMKQKYIHPVVRAGFVFALALLGMYTIYTYGGLVPYRFIWQG